VDATRRGRGDHSYLLTVLLILELWQQEAARAGREVYA
jgi:hypothetical protein